MKGGGGAPLVSFDDLVHRVDKVFLAGSDDQDGGGDNSDGGHDREWATMLSSGNDVL
jgi:hypothetical protein